MAKNTQSKSRSLKYSNQVQDVFVDRLSRFSIGTMSSKLEFSIFRDIENTDEAEINLVVNIPTGNLISAIKQIYSQTNDPKVRKELADDLKNYITFLEYPDSLGKD